MSKVRTEAFDIMQNYYRTVHDPLIRCMFQFNGRLDADVLERAVNLSTAAIPQIACRFDSKSHGWAEMNFTAKDMLTIVPEENGTAAEKLLLSTIGFEQEPQLKLFLFRGEQNDTLCAIISHLVADAAGFKQYLYLLAQLYSLCAKDPDYNIASKAGDRSLGQLLRGYSFHEKKSIFTSKQASLHEEASMYPPLQGDKNRQFIIRCSLERSEFEAVKSYGKSHSASVNDMLMTAFARALSRWTGSSHIEFPCPVDIRKYLKNREACGICNLTSNYLCSADLSADDPFEKTLHRIAKQMAAQKESSACLKGPAFLNILFHILPESAIQALLSKIFTIPVVSYTNMGILDEKLLAFGNVNASDVFLSTAVKYAPYFQVSVSTWKGNCSLCSSFHGMPKDEQQIRDFMDSMKKELLSLTD